MIKNPTHGPADSTAGPEHFAAVAARHFTDPRILTTTETPMPDPVPATAESPHPTTRRIRDIAEMWAAGTVADPGAAMTQICSLLGVKLDTDTCIAGRAGAR